MRRYISTKRIFEILDFKVFHLRLKAIDFHIECSSREVGLAIENLMEEIQAVISEKSEFENRDESKLLAFFSNSGQSGS